MTGLRHRSTLLAMVALSAHAESPAPDASTVAKRERNVSSHIASAIADGLPKFSPVPADPMASPPAAFTESRNAIVHLPAYIVREKRPPSPEDMLTAKGWEEDAAERYLGPKDGLDRSLNEVSLLDLWKRIPVLGKIPFVPFGSMTNGQRAQFLYERVEAKRRWAELLDFGTPAPVTEKPRKKP